MAKRPSVKEILEAARKGGPAKPADESSPGAEEAAGAEPVEELTAAESIASSPPAADIPTPATLGRPLTLKEKLAAARAGGAAAACGRTGRRRKRPLPRLLPPRKARQPPRRPRPFPRRPSPGPADDAARKAGRGTWSGTAPASLRGAAKPAAAKPAAAAAAKTAAARMLPPLDEITDPKDLAEAARQASAKKAKELAAGGRRRPAKAAGQVWAGQAQTVPPRPTRDLAGEATAPSWTVNRRGFCMSALFVSWVVAWIIAAWVTFTGCGVDDDPDVRAVHVPQRAGRAPEHHQGRPSLQLRARRSQRAASRRNGASGSSGRHGYDGQDIIYALQSVCTHLGCPPNWLAAEQKFKCPCHGSGFYISGINFEGPAPRPLERFKVALADDGQIMVDKSQKFQQELGQWSDPDSFIPA